MSQSAMWVLLLGFAGAAIVHQPSWAETVVKQWRSEGVKKPRAEEVKPLHRITRLRDHHRPTTTVKDWLAQVEAATVQVTNVRVDRTDFGLEITLETSESKPLHRPATVFRTEGNNLIADIPNAVLALPNATEFSADTPTEEIANVRVTQVNASTIRVAVAGNGALPKQEVTLKAGAFAYTLNPEGETPEEEIVVTGERQGGYNVPNATTATKTDTPLRDIPQSIQVIPREVIEDQGAVRLNEIVRNVSSVSTSNNDGGQSQSYKIRGFDANVYKNGFIDDYLSDQDSANIERVEVLKGPASVLFGRLEPSGIINLVTKKPLADPYYNISFTAGSYSFYRPTLDFSGPITADGKLGYRLNIDYENSGSFRDFVHKERFFIAPVLSWKIGDNTNLTLEGEYLHTESPYDRGLVTIGDRVADIPISRYLSDPRNLVVADGSKTYLTLNHEFNQNLSVRTAFRVTTALYTFNRFVLQGLGASDDGTLALYNTPLSLYRETYYLQNDLTAKFNTGSVKHTLLFGVELGKESQWQQNEEEPNQSINIFNPVYNFSFGPYQLSRDNAINSTSFEIYLQDQISVFDNLLFLVGGRFDTYHSTAQDFLNASNTKTDSDAFSPRVGIVYQPTKEISLFANYSRSFVPITGSDKNNNAFVPERGTGYEAGIKGDFFNGRLSSTLAFYTVTKTNVVTADPSDPANFEIQVGEQRARGIELDAAGEILPGWKIIASYGYIDAEVTKDNSYPIGNTLSNTPRHTGSLWTTYTFQTGPLEGFGFGGGIFAASKAYGNLDNSFTVPGFIRTDAALFYKKERLRASVNFKNLFSTRYFETAFFGSAYPAAPFTVQGTISWEF